MWQDVTQLRDFYGTPLGQVARRLVLEAILRLWPHAEGQRLLGYGYALPYLRPFRDGSSATVAALPAPQGVHAWPEEGPQVACLAEEAELPFADMTFDRVLVVHGLEHSEQVRHLLRELWRVTAGEGRVLFVVPGRRGIWSRSDRTPFGWGHPYSLAQLRQLLSDQLFDPTRWDRALYLPPTGGRWMLRSAPLLERAGHRFLFRAAGVHLIEAVKQLYAPTGLGAVKAGKRARAQVVSN